MNQVEYAQALSPHLPSGTSEIVTEWIFKHKIDLKISRDRKTKLGDYRRATNNDRPRISINSGLNSYSFLITLVHELAHAIVYEKNHYRVQPHGKEWKREYKQLMLIFFAKNIFPDDINRPLAAYMKNPKASSGSDQTLQRALRKYDARSENVLFLEDLEEGALFNFQSRSFKKGTKRRSRYSCWDLNNKREYAISGIAEVERLKTK